MTVDDKGRARILVAEDDRTTSFLIASMLASERYEVICAKDGQECLRLVRTMQPQLLILDLMMPKIHGLDVLKQLRQDEHTRDIGVIVCSAKNYKTEHDQARELGTYEFLSKPFSKGELLDRVQRFFARDGEYGGNGLQVENEPTVSADLYRPQIQRDSGSYVLWGTRGSIPVSGPQYVRHGGNTSCLEFSHGDERILFDAGSGIREVGLSLISDPPRKLHLFITHTHWDHIQGFPFFAPAYVPGYDIAVYAPPNIDQDLESIFRGQLDRAYFHVQMEDMQAHFEFNYLGEESVQIGDVQIDWEYTFHPGSTVGYKIEVGGRRLAYLPDNEFLKGYLGPPLRELDREVEAIHRRLIDFCSGVDVLLHEAQYTHDEYPEKIGWGHTSVANACTLVKLSGVGKWTIIHHDPAHGDDFLQDKLNLTRQVLRDLDCDVEVFHGYDGQVGYL